MSVIAYIELGDGQVKKAAYETAAYAGATAQKLGTTAIGLAMGSVDAASLEELGSYGLTEVIHVNQDAFNQVDSKQSTKAIADVVAAKGGTVVVFSHGYTGKNLAPRVAARLQAGIVAGAVALPTVDSGFHVKKTAFSSKGFVVNNITTPIKVVSVAPNAYGAQKGEGTATVSSHTVEVAPSSITFKERVKLSDTIPLTEADMVVSAGRGLKGPENWGMVEELATLLGAATACSRPVADVHWRPHHEHVGQTGIAISPNLYIAIAISGAIQHLAGVSSSNTIVVINKDAEAPFFKNADYGIVGDAFEVVPKLIEEIRKVKA